MFASSTAWLQQLVNCSVFKFGISKTFNLTSKHFYFVMVVQKVAIGQTIRAIRIWWFNRRRSPRYALKNKGWWVHCTQVSCALSTECKHFSCQFMWIGCPEDCIVDDYHLTPTTSKFDFENIDDFQNTSNNDRSVRHSALHFFYPSFCFSLVKNHPGSLVKWISKTQLWRSFWNVWSLIDAPFAGEVGGNMSLFVGASLVTLIEFFVFIFRSMLRFWTLLSTNQSIGLLELCGSASHLINFREK